MPWQWPPVVSCLLTVAPEVYPYVPKVLPSSSYFQRAVFFLLTTVERNGSARLDSGLRALSAIS